MTIKLNKDFRKENEWVKEDTKSFNKNLKYLFINHN